MTKRVISICLAIMLIIATFSAVGLSVTAEDNSQDSQYRNLAFRRAAWHSTAADYNQTGHLVTDGLYEDSDSKPVYSDQHGNSPAAETPAKAFDKLTTTKWLTFAGSAWLQIELPDSYIKAPAASYIIASANDDNLRDPVDWTIQGSNDGVSFVDIDSRQNEAWTARQQTRTFTLTDNNTAYKYYRLNILKNNGDEGYQGTGTRTQISEFDMFDAQGNSIFGQPDDSFKSYWQSGAAGEQYVYIDLGAESTIDKAVIRWGNGYATSYDIQVSDDAKEWKTVKSITNGAGKVETVEFDAQKAQYVRVLCKATTSAAYVINEVEVWGANDFNYTIGELPEALEDGTQYLTGGNWKISRADEVEADGATLSGGSYDDSSWLPATVPGTALISYLNAGAIPDPNYDDWQLQISDSYFTTNYWYTNSFVVPAERQGKTTWLNFDSINWKADIYLNGQYIDRINGAFIRTKLDVTEYVKYGEENYLAVYIHMNDNPGAVTEQTMQSAGSNGGILGGDNPTIHASIGWDWVPTIRGRNVGIYDEVYLTYTNEVQIRYPWAVTDLELGYTEDRTDELNNLATAATATASSTENEYNNGANVPSKANDGNMNTRWSSTYYDNQWFMLEFAQPTTFNAVIIQWEDAHSSDYVLQYSNDGETFTDIKSVPNCTGGKDIQAFDEVTAKYIRISMGGRVTKYGHSFWEFAVYNTDHKNLEPIIHESDFSKTDVTVSADISNTYDEEVTATVNGVITPGDIKFSKEITVPANSVEEITIDGIVIENPELWWPNTYGDQFLYNCELTVAINDEISDKQSFDFGVREFTYSEGSPLEIYCNGTRISGRGGNWGMDDSNLAATDEEYDIKVRLHAEANFTMIRNWVGMTGNDAFYEACDKYGILIFDDFWLANPADGPNPNDESMFLTNAVDKIKRVRKHASLALYCGRNEGNPPESLNTALNQYTTELDGTRHYIPHSATGTVSGYGPYGVRDPEYYFGNAPITLHSERGMPNVPSLESIQSMLSEENQWPINSVWGLHDFTLGSAQNGQSYLNEMSDYGSYDSLESFTRIAQMVNYENHKALFEATFNKRGNGILMWMSQSAWPSFVWQTYDYYYDTNAGYFGLKAGNQPVNAIWNCINGNIVLTNNTPNDYKDLMVNVNVYDLNGKLIWSDEAISDIKSDSNEIVTRVEYPADTTDIKFIKTFVYDANGEKLAEDFYWTNSVKYQNYAGLNTLPYVELDATYDLLEKDGTTNYYTVNVENNTDSPALLIRVKTSNDLTGERVLPAYYEDNYFSLMPGESKEITVEFEDSKLNGGQPVFEIEGWNVTDGQIDEDNQSQTPVVYDAKTDATEYLVNAPVTFTVTTNRAACTLDLVNESGKLITKRLAYCTENDNGTLTWTVSASFGTKGERTISIFTVDENGVSTDSGIDVSFIVDTAISGGNDPVAVYDVIAPPTATKNGVFAITVETSTSTTKVGIFNESGSALGKVSQSYVDKDDTRTWLISLKIGSRGNRKLTVKATDRSGEWSEGEQINISVK